jgi:hypothetical protein
MGVVYRATQLALDRTVALKVIAPAARGSDGQEPVRARVEGRGVDRSPERDPDLLRGRRGRDRVHRDALRRRRRRAQPRPPRGAAAARAGGEDRRPDRLGARRGTRRGPRAPRHQARERPADRRGARLPDELRAHEARAVGGRVHEARPLGRHARLRRPRADPGRAGGCAGGRLRARVPAVLRPHGRGGVQARRRRGAAVGAPVRAAVQAQPGPPRDPAGVRRRDRARAREGPRGALPVRRRPGPRRPRRGREPAPRGARAARRQGRRRAG